MAKRKFAFFEEKEKLKKEAKIDSWSVSYDSIHDALDLTIYWDNYGFKIKISAPALTVIIATLKAARRTNTSVYFNGDGSNPQIYTMPIPLKIK